MLGANKRGSMINPQRATALGVAVANVVAKKTNSSNKITVRIV